MAHYIYAVDFGAWSLKVAIAEPGFRHATISAVVERPIPPGDEPYDQRAGRVLRELVDERQLWQDTCYFVVAGDQLFTKVLEFAFSSLRRADLERAVGAELEGVVPIDLEDMVYAFEPLPSDRSKDGKDGKDGKGNVAGSDGAGPAAGAGPDAASDDEPTNVHGPAGVAGAGAPASRGRVAAAAAGMRVLTYAMRRDRAQQLILLGASQQAEPRGLLPTAGCLVRFVNRVWARGAAPVAVIDMGHGRTDVVVIQHGKPVFSRTVARGGRHVTDAISKAWRLGVPEAERAKHTDGFIASSFEPATSDAWQRVSDAVSAELVPLARDLRQTLAACRAHTGVEVAAVYLVGGASRMRGMTSFLAEQLGVTVAGVPPEAGAGLGPRLADTPVDTAACVIGGALDGASGRPLFDLRQGVLAFKVDLSFLRAKAYQIATAAVIILAFAAGSAWAAHYKLRKNEKVLTNRLATESTELYGGPRTASDVLDQVDSTATATAGSPLPKMTAYDLLLAINDKLPDKDKITLDVTRLQITPTSVELRGTTKKTEEIDALEAALKDIKCLGAASRGATQQTAEGSMFQLSYKPTCM
jgi:Tfp pilus assembly PilM family ATPase